MIRFLRRPPAPEPEEEAPVELLGFDEPEPKEEGADISISVKRQNERVIILVSDTGPGSDSQYTARAAESTGVGLANIRDRLAQAYGDNHRFETQSDIQGGFRVLIDIPYQIEEAEEPK